MRKVNRSALVPYTGREMFSLVDDVESYPEFVPWCNDATVESRSGNSVVATLELHKGPISKHFTTRNTRRDFEAIDMELVGGPFRQLSGGWRFRDIEDQGCRVSLELEFEFESRLVDMMFGAFFKEAGDSLVDAFTKRAREVYGPR
ncbi:MAG TPA: type II toxin-antitoxin system RatA family toxin [Woeseiaceae bacterium]|nr:type II toxin-antitoxin system RatA family toxin [Woeseiaceae bacterium]